MIQENPNLARTSPKQRDAQAAVREVVDAVCAELGVNPRQRERRLAIERRIVVAYQSGPRQPLDLVRAGLEG